MTLTVLRFESERSYKWANTNKKIGLLKTGAKLVNVITTSWESEEKSPPECQDVDTGDSHGAVGLGDLTCHSLSRVSVTPGYFWFQLWSSWRWKKQDLNGTREKERSFGEIKDERGEKLGHGFEESYTRRGDS